MQKKILVMLSGCMLFLGLKAQVNSLNEILRQVELNNKELSAIAAFHLSARKELISQQEIKLRTHFLFLGI